MKQTDDAEKRICKAFDPMLGVCGKLWMAGIPLIIAAAVLLIIMMPRSMEDGKGMSMMLLIFLLILWMVPFSIWAELKSHINRSVKELREHGELDRAADELEDKEKYLFDNKYTTATEHYLFLRHDGEIMAYDRIGWYHAESVEDDDDDDNNDKGENGEKLVMYYLTAGRDGRKGLNIFLGEEGSEENLQRIIKRIEQEETDVEQR